MGNKRQVGRGTGMTLIELVIATGILLFAMVGVLGAYTTLTNASNLAGDRMLALQDAQLVMESLRAWQLKSNQNNIKLPEPSGPPTPLNNGNDSNAWKAWLSSIKQASDGNGKVRALESEDISVSVVPATSLDPSLTPGMQAVTVQVTWQGRGGQLASGGGVRLDSFFTPRPDGT